MTPVVLHHGLFGYDERRIGPWTQRYFRGIGKAIVDQGHRLIVPRVHPTGAVERRAQELKDVILGKLAEADGKPRGRVVIIAHSLGGLDARYMISKLEMAPFVSTLVTVTAPHRGSPYADWIVRNIGQRLGIFSLVKRMGLDFEGLLDATTQRCRRFNEAVPDAPGVRYFSVSAARPWTLVPPFGLHGHKVVYDAEGDNDCLVSVRSSTWGENLGVWPADHWHTINLRFVLELKNPTGDIAPYYLKILQRLANKGLMEE